MQRQTEAENAAAEAEQLQVQEQEWNMAELERIQEQQVRAASFPGIGYRFKVHLSLCHSHNHVWQHVSIDNQYDLKPMPCWHSTSGGGNLAYFVCTASVNYVLLFLA